MTLSDARKGLLIRFRFADADNIIDNPTDDELNAALEDGIGYINSFPPTTRWDLDYFLNDNLGLHWKTVWYNAAAMYVLQMILTDLTANSYDVNFQELSVPDRTSSYESMLSTVKDNLDSQLETLKQSVKRFRSIGPIQPPFPLRYSSGYRGINRGKFRLR